MMKFATALLIFSATGHASAGGPVADPALAAPAAAAAAPDATEKHPRDPGSNLRRTANGASTGVDVAAAPPDHQRRLTTAGSATDVYTATGTSVATCAGVGQNLATRGECATAAASLGFGGVLGTGGWDNAPPGCICEPTNNNCWFNTLSGGPAREDRFLVCKDTRAYTQAGSAHSIYTATGTAVASCAGVGQNLATIAECRAAVASLGFGAVVATGGWDSLIVPPGCICEPTNNDCWFNPLMEGPAREDRFLVCKDTQASLLNAQFYAQMLALQQAFYAQQALYNSDMLALQQAFYAQQALYNSDMLALQEASGALQAAGLGPEFKTDNGHLVYPRAAILDPTGTSRRTAFDFVAGADVGDSDVHDGYPPVDANGNHFWMFEMQAISTSRACGERCLARSAEVHGLVGYSYVAGLDYCVCYYDTAVAYTETHFFDYTDGTERGTGRLRSGPQGDSWEIYDADGASTGWEIYERVYVL